MTVLVVDASVVVDALIDRQRQQGFRTAVGSGHLVAPAHMKSEALSAIGRLHRADEVTQRRATEAVTSLRDFPIEQVPIDLLLTDAWQLRDNIRLADAIYVALARQRKVTLLTVDERLVAAAPDVARLPGAGPDSIPDLS